MGAVYKGQWPMQWTSHIWRPGGCVEVESILYHPGEIAKFGPSSLGGEKDIRRDD